jgi:transposase InsO family protein
MQARLDRCLVLKALEAAPGYRRPEAGLLHHSDRGSQYASGDSQAKLEASGILCSMSRRGNCSRKQARLRWDNAPVESFFGTLKQELVNRCHFATRDVARQEVLRCSSTSRSGITGSVVIRAWGISAPSSSSAGR